MTAEQAIDRVLFILIMSPNSHVQPNGLLEFHFDRHIYNGFVLTNADNTIAWEYQKQ